MQYPPRCRIDPDCIVVGICAYDMTCIVYVHTNAFVYISTCELYEVSWRKQAIIMLTYCDRISCDGMFGCSFWKYSSAEYDKSYLVSISKQRE